MPIVVVQPTSGQPFGQGWTIDVTTDHVGPIGSPLWSAIVEVLDGGIETPTISDTWVPADPHLHAPHIMLFDFGLQPGNRLYVNGATAQLHVELFGSAGFHESTTVTIEIDAIQGPLAVLSRKLAEIEAAAGLSEEQSTQLAETHSATRAQMSIGGVLQDIDISSIITHPPLGLLSLAFPTGPFSGDGSLSMAGLPLEVAYGLLWNYTEIPPQLGRTVRGLPEFTQTMLQLRVYHELDGVTYISEWQDFNADNFIWRWGEFKPSRVDYSILPGVEVLFTWLT